MLVENNQIKISKLLINLILVVCSTFFIIPLLYIVSISFSRELDLTEFGYRLLPMHPNTLAYNYIFSNPKQLINSYMVSIIVTIAGTVLSLLVTAMLAYPMSRKDYRYKNATSFFIFFTMLFSGGLIPWYILITNYLHLKNTLLALILPYCVLPWFVLLMKGFLSALPMEIFESAKIDGSSEMRIFFLIVLPLSKPALATLGLFNLLMFWNDWWLSLLFIDVDKLLPLQYLLYRIMSNLEFLATQAASSGLNFNLKDFPNESARMAICVLAAGPMLFVFPFFQKYFVKGLTVGSLKG